MGHKYETYKFVSPTRVYARVREELRDFFATGAVDSVMFPIWTDDVIKQFRKTFLPIKETCLCLQDGECELPEGFIKIREAWGTTIHQSDPFTTGGSVYYPKDYHTVTLIDRPLDDFQLDIKVNTYQVVHKVTEKHIINYQCNHTLVEGINYTIDGNQFKTANQSGVVHIIYYADGIDEYGEQLIPDNYFIQQYLEKYIVYMLFRQLFNQASVDTYNQMKDRKRDAESEMFDAKIKAETETKSETLQRKIQKIKKSYHRHDKYRL